MNDRSLITAREIANRLRVPVSWVYSQTQKIGDDAIPCLRVGKYCRFIEDDVFKWLENISKGDNSNE